MCPQFRNDEPDGLVPASVPNGGGPYSSITWLAAAFQSSAGMVLFRRVEVDRTEQTDVRLIAAPDVLDVAHVRLRPGIILLPGLPDVAPGDLDERDEALGVQVVDLLVHRLEIGRIDALHIGKILFVTGHFARKQKGPIARLVGHVFGAVRARLPPGRAQNRAVGRLQRRRLVVVGPVRQRGENGNAVELLLAAIGDEFLESRLRSERTQRVVIAPTEPKGRRGPPGIAQQEDTACRRHIQTRGRWPTAGSFPAGRDFPVSPPRSSRPR